MRYFKAEITYESDSNKETARQSTMVLYCCSATSFPKNDELQELFYSLDGAGTKYLSASWRQVREEEIPTDEIHLIT